MCSGEWHVQDYKTRGGGGGGGRFFEQGVPVPNVVVYSGHLNLVN